MLFPKADALNGELDKDGMPTMAWLLSKNGSKWDGTLFLYQEGVLLKPDQCPNASVDPIYVHIGPIYS